LKAFDSAITRPGRFDLQLFVGTPNLEARMTQFQQKLSEEGTDEATKTEAMKVYRTFLESVWSQDAMFQNFLESKQFASACAKVVISNGKLTNSEMSAILSQQAAVMTVRGSAREEFVASMELSRL
jgi:SpoVK/Ycf46/Vps4 family AAA+-type ATPase